MYKKLAVVSILLVSLMFVSAPANATPAARCPSVMEYYYCDDYDEDGTYDFCAAYFSIAGNMKLSITVKDYASATITLPKLENLGDLGGEWFVFWAGDETWEWGGYGDTLLYNYSPEVFGVFGGWEQVGCNLYMDYYTLLENIQYMLEEYLAESEYEVDYEISANPEYTAKIDKNGVHSGKISIKVYLYSPLEGSFTLALTYKSHPLLLNDPKIKQAKAALKRDPKKAKPVFTPEVKSFLADALSKLPKKGAASKKK